MMYSKTVSMESMSLTWLDYIYIYIYVKDIIRYIYSITNIEHSLLIDIAKLG